MKLIDRGRAEELSVHAAKVGRGFDRIELDATDFYKLSQLSPEALHDWLTHWQCGFRTTG